jgi:hypothetical protein
MKRSVSYLLFVVVFLVGLVACNLPFGSPPTAPDENAINTSVAQTLSALGGAASTEAVNLPTAGAEPTITTAPLPTAALPTIAPTAVPPTQAPTQDTCNRASWVEDITYPDGSVLLPNKDFVKTWRVKNVGTCTWNTSYAVVYYSGDQMGAPAASPLLGNVAPGATVDLSVNMKSPGTNGEYRGDFMLRSDTGLIFGTGSLYTASIYNEIKVSSIMLMPTFIFSGVIELLPLETLIYNFASNYCSASWRNATAPGTLPCPGTNSDAAGFVVRNDDPKLSNGTTYNGVALVTHPQWIDGGSIAGIYPVIAVQNGMKFRATLGCRYEGTACKVHYFLRYYEQGVAVLKQLNQWDLEYADTPLKVDVDLSSLAGKNISFVLQTTAYGSPNQDWAQWVNPRIIK